MYFLLFIIVAFIQATLFTTHTIYGGDGGDLTTAAYLGGNPHPPGYPLYTLISFLFVHGLKWNSVAYNVSLVSTISSVLSCYILFLILKKITKNEFISLISSLFFQFLYPVWIYSVVPEVFTFLNFLVLITLYFGLQYYQTRDKKYLYLSSFCYGLATFHHHLAVMIIPGLYGLYLTTPQIKKISLQTKDILVCVICFIGGLSQYLYSIVAAFHNPLVNWNDPKTLTNLINYISRANYGTFAIGPFASFSLYERFISMLSFLIYFYDTFKIVGILILFIGSVYLYQKNKKAFIFFAIELFFIFFFYFYAGLPLTYSLNVGIYEKFLCFFLLIFSLPFAFGLLYLKNILSSRFFSIISFLLLIFVFIINYKYIHSLHTDLSAETIGKDFLQLPTKNSILFVTSDTGIFNTHYVQFVQKYNEKIALLYGQRISEKSSLNRLKQLYPHIKFSAYEKISSPRLLEQFILQNKDIHIYSEDNLVTTKGKFLPYGIVYEYHYGSVNEEDIIRQNDKLWAQYQRLNPKDIKYRNLLLSDVLRIYSNGHAAYGKYLFEIVEDRSDSRLAKAEYHLKKALELLPQRLQTRIYLSQVYLLKNDCQKAAESLKDELKINQNSSEGLKLLTLIYSTCIKDTRQYKYYLELSRELDKQNNTPLE